MARTYKLNPGLHDSGETTNFWPSFVDALSSVLLVLVFALMIFVIGQTHMSIRINNQAHELTTTSKALKNAITNRERLWAELANANYSTQAMKTALTHALGREADLAEEMKSLRIALTGLQQSDTSKNQIITNLEKTISSLNETTDNLKSHNETLGLKYTEVRALVALAQKRSDFLMQIAEGLKGMKGIRQHGDRFVFDASLLFKTASAGLTPSGHSKIEELALVIKKIVDHLPANVSWVLRIDGHTDAVPIRNATYKSNWELSFARAMTVLQTLVKKGIPIERLAAAGFGEHHPVSDKSKHAENRRIEIRLDSF